MIAFRYSKYRQPSINQFLRKASVAPCKTEALPLIISMFALPYAVHGNVYRLRRSCILNTYRSHADASLAYESMLQRERERDQRGKGDRMNYDVFAIGTYLPRVA